MEIINHLLTQIIFTFGIVVVFGMLIALGRRIFCRLLGPAGPRVLLITGIVGTPIHELGHALMCILFGHRITEMKLYSPEAENGVLGYVKHSYNPRNIYHQIGNFFIGVAPIICGSGVLLLLMNFMLPDMFATVLDSLSGFEGMSSDLGDIASTSFSVLLDVVKTVFDFSNAGNVLWWLFIILAIMIAGHMEVSGADIKGGLGGFFFIAVLLAIADTVLYFIDTDILDTVTETMTGFSSIIIGFLAISLVFIIALVIIALAVNIVSRILGR